MLDMNILLLAGSGFADSHTLHLAQAIQASLDKAGANTELINLIEQPMPLYNMQTERDDAYNEITRDFLNKSEAADAFVWVTPIYHNSFSGILKNALDWQHSKFPGKVVGMASHGGGRSPQAVDQLLMVARAQHGISVRIRVCTQKTDFDENLNITEPMIIDRIATFTDELVSLTKKINA